MTLKHLKIFLTVCREGTITNAAKVLFMSQPAVSLAIRELEEYYGVKLFDRISHRLYLTAPGKVVLDYAGNILHMYDEMELVLKQKNAKESLLVGNSVGSSIFSQLMKGFSDKYENIEPKVIIDHTSTITRKVLNNEVDIATVEGIAVEPELVSEIFANEVMYAVVSTDHKLANKDKLCLNDLKQERFLLREKYSGARAVIDSVFNLHKIDIVPYWESSASLMLLDAVLLGIGVTILPYFLVAPYIRNNQLVPLNIVDAEFIFPYSIIYRKNKYRSNAVKEFCTYCKEEAAKFHYEADELKPKRR